MKDKASKTADGVRERSQSSASAKKKKTTRKEGDGKEPLLESGTTQDTTNEDIVSQRSSSNPAPSGEMSNYKQMIYLFVARDAEMFVFEHHIEKQVQLAKFQAEVFEQLTLYQNQDEEAKAETLSKDLLFDGLQLHMQFDVIYYGIITQ
jgi:hypothetical protein